MPPIIIDTHQHLWDLEQVAYPWLTPDPGLAHLYCRRAGAAARRRRGQLHCARPVGQQLDTGICSGRAAVYPWIAGVVGWVPLLYPDVAGRVLERFCANRMFKGIRHLIHNRQTALAVAGSGH